MFKNHVATMTQNETALLLISQFVHDDEMGLKTKPGTKRERSVRHTQLGIFAEGPSHPMCATCFTSVGNPICISSSFSSAKMFS